MYTQLNETYVLNKMIVSLHNNFQAINALNLGKPVNNLSRTELMEKGNRKKEKLKRFIKTYLASGQNTIQLHDGYDGETLLQKIIKLITIIDTDCMELIAELFKNLPQRQWESIKIYEDDTSLMPVLALRMLEEVNEENAFEKFLDNILQRMDIKQWNSLDYDELIEFKNGIYVELVLKNRKWDTMRDFYCKLLLLEDSELKAVQPKQISDLSRYASKSALDGHPEALTQFENFIKRKMLPSKPEESLVSSSYTPLKLAQLGKRKHNETVIITDRVIKPRTLSRSMD